MSERYLQELGMVIISIMSGISIGNSLCDKTEETKCGTSETPIVEILMDTFKEFEYLILNLVVFAVCFQLMFCANSNLGLLSRFYNKASIFRRKCYRILVLYHQMAHNDGFQNLMLEDEMNDPSTSDEDDEYAALNI